ncbi:BLUF domain-containing protein [Cellulophaga baltica]|uniref:BLUF domain-containing protein n=1 Tax=Cellulophaga TaxID=104264 RepID=UPI001C072717|nr:MULTISPECIES: BLUF domain-containing protein [Cellulophaga]MBU2995582.1 BLUF domain-containing protein [Cellulophaga baltica]MDO6766976.1 BLUF domain-containing protein [Cellulophaga sp. 1_MG-2023]
MFELTYRSLAVSSISKQEITSILEEANDFNSKHNITGCLVYYNNHFIQILEGEKKIVKDIYKKISTDKRHKNVITLSEGEKDIKFFPDWNMAYASPNASEVHLEEVKMYANNLLLLSEFMDKPTTTLKMFWEGIRRVIEEPKY